MRRSKSIALILLALVVMLAGCETIKGMARGASEGFQKDWQEAKKIDDWMRQNLW